MALLLIVPLIILWAIIQKNIVDTTGHAPRSRASFRYQRRKARKWDMDDEDVPIDPQLTPVEPFKLSQRTNYILAALTALMIIGMLWH